MSGYQKLVSLSIAFALLFVVVELVRRRKLRIEYSWVWIAAVAGLIALIVFEDFLLWLTDVIGAVSPASTIMILAFLFLVAICIHFSLKISRLSNQVKKLTQELALREADEKEAERTRIERGEGV